MSKEVEITPELVAEHGLSGEEYAMLCDMLGRTPKITELGIASVMWSEHCSYKSSRMHLAKFPTTGKRVICGPGENAGIVDFDDGDAVIFKMESHNHPSFIEPYQGAATGVGGIMRDVFTMGARPVANLNALRFGAIDHSRTKSLVAGVVAGIGGYGNCVGVPTVGGETNFDAGYNGNILVNAMCVGTVRTDSIFYSAAKGAGNTILYVGSRTGRDGIHGATMASAEFDDDSDEKRPTVQVGDPFTEKRLIEACLELMQTGNIVAIQDMGAAGLTSSSVEMADKGGVGIELDLNAVPQRETGMTPYEMMLSESQERMLIVLKPGTEAQSRQIFTKWELDVAVIGKTTDTGRLVLSHHGETVCDMPVAPLSDLAPKYDRPWDMPAELPELDAAGLPESDPVEAMKTLMTSPDMASKRWVWEQYDRHVQTNTLTASGSACDAAIVRMEGTNKGIAMTSDCTPRYVQAAAREGGKQAVAESWRNLVASGAEPVAITNCLNFGNPERTDVMGQFVQAIEGMAEACEALNYPVVSGNVSLYNETSGAAIPPTPTVGGVGLVRDLDRIHGYGAAHEGNLLYIVGETKGWLGASLFARLIAGKPQGFAPPPVDLDAEKAHGSFVRQVLQSGLATGAHDISDGGMACAAAEIAMASNIGVRMEEPEERNDAQWFFGEDQGRYMMIVPAGKLDKFLTMARKENVKVAFAGKVGGDELRLGHSRMPVSELRRLWESRIPELMESQYANVGE